MLNLFNNIPKDLPEEIFETIAQSDSVKIERIISKGHITPTDTWYDQNQAEWVMLIQGAAKIVFDNKPPANLQKGDAILIPAHQKHQVAWTEPDKITIWLAVHFT